MRRLLPHARSFLIHSGQTTGLVAIALLAMAAAPLATPDAATAEPGPALTAPPVTATAEPAGPVMRKLAFARPVRGYAVNSRFGVRKLAGEAAPRAHKGVDIAAPKGTGVYVAAEGRVIRTGFDAAGYGAFVEVRHPNGMTSLYGHLSRVDVASGMTLSSGQRVGLVGSTGYSTGPHLHFEVKRGDRQIDPSKVMGRSFDIVVRPVS